MTVASSTSRIDYTGTGTLTYAYNFYIFTNTDLQVYVSGVLKTLTTDYTVTGAGTPSGGNVVFVASVNGLAIAIIRVEPLTQLTDYVPNDAFPADTHEAALDKLTMICQQLTEKLGRALTVASKSLQSNLLVDDLVAGKFLQVKTPASSGLQMVDITASGSIGIPVSIAQGGTGQITALAALNALGMGTVVLKKGTGAGDYTTASTTPVNVDGTNLSYTVTIPVGWKLIVIVSGSVNTATAAVQVYTALADGGTPVIGQIAQGASTNTNTNFGFSWEITGDGASHTLSLQFATSNVADVAHILNTTANTVPLIPVMVFLLMPSN